MSEPFDDLISDVEWQKKSLLEYIGNNFVKKPAAGKTLSVLEAALQNLLNSYLQMADKFYLQFRDSLKNAYEAGQAGDSSKPEKLISENDVPVLMQQALDKLVAEWERVYDFISAHPTGKSMGGAEKLKLLPVINAAILDIGFSSETCLVIPDFGTAYSLGFFNYTDDFLPLTMPLTRIRSPWEWTIFWHEIAGQKIRLLKNNWLSTKNMYEEMFLEIKSKPDEYPKEIFGEGMGMSKKYQDKLDSVRESCRTISVISILPKLIPLGVQQDDINKISDPWEYVHQDLVEFLNQDSAVPALTNTKKYFSNPSQPMLMLSFDELLDQTLSTLPAPMREKALSNGWSTDWLEELFEDSFSTLNFDFNFLFILDHLLRRSHGGKGLRHPSREVRLAAALSMKLISVNPGLKNNANPPSANDWHIPSDSGLDEGDLRLLGKFEPALLGEEESLVVWQFAKKVIELHEWMNIQLSDDEPMKGVKTAISQAMTGYIHKKEEADSVATAAEKRLNKLKIASHLLEPILSKTTIQKRELNDKRTKKIEALFRRKSILNPQLLDYLELLALKFFDIDFNVEIPHNIDFTYESITYHTNSVNFKNALSSALGFITTSGSPTDKVKIDNHDCYITKANLDVIKSKGWIWM